MEIPITLTEDLHTRLRTEAELLGTTLDKFIPWALEEFLRYENEHHGHAQA